MGMTWADETGNPSFRGWIYETDVDICLKEAAAGQFKVSVQQKKDENEDYWVVNSSSTIELYVVVVIVMI